MSWKRHLRARFRGVYISSGGAGSPERGGVDAPEMESCFIVTRKPLQGKAGPDATCQERLSTLWANEGGYQERH